MRPPLRATLACAFVALAWSCALIGTARADQQRDPELKALLQKIIGDSDCFADKFDSEVWYKTMEPRLARLVPTHEARVEILDHVYCEAKRDPSLPLPPDLVLALIEVESRFDRWAVSPAGAVGLMQVMPFWPHQLGVQNQLVQVAPNIRHGLRDSALLSSRREPQLVARAGTVQRQHRPQHLSGAGHAALAARLALLIGQKIPNSAASGPASSAAVSRTSSTRAWAGPRCSHARSSPTAAAAPCASTSTEPSGKLRALPRRPSRWASSRVL